MNTDLPDKARFVEITNELSNRDSRLAGIMKHIGPCQLECGSQGIAALAYSVIGQQLSNSSARAIRTKFNILFQNSNIDAESLVRMSNEELRRAGLSLAKSRCLRSFANHVLAGKIDLPKLETMSNEAVIKSLSQVKGIGRWTAEMYLIFSLGRLDVFPVDDSSIRAAMIRIYHIQKTNFTDGAKKISDQWRPFRTIACWYLYRYMDTIRDKTINVTTDQC